MKTLFRMTGFIPYILVVFLNAFVDLGHKIIIQNSVFKLYDGQTQILLTAVINALILLPFILLFSPAGHLSDRYAKPRIIRACAWVAVGLTLLITLCYYQGWFELAFALTFLLGVQSAIYSPAKYGYIREMAGQEQLAKANAWVQAVTIVAILLGVLLFSIVFEQFLSGQTAEQADQLLQIIAPIGWGLVIFSMLELLFSYRLPVLKPAGTRIPRFETRRYFTGDYLRINLKSLRSSRTIWLSIVGLSVFWGISQVFLATFPAYAKARLAVDNTVLIQGLLACSGVGIVLGSLVAGRASKRYIETGLIPLGAVGVVLSLMLLPILESPVLIGLDFIGFGLAGGCFIVPLNSLIQFKAREQEIGRILAGNNWVQNLVMLSFLGVTLAFAYLGLDALGLFHLLTLVAVAGAAYCVYRLPHSLVRYLVARLFAGSYRVQVLGFDNLPSRGAVLMLGNHISWIDWALIQIACPRPIRFVMHRDIYQRWYLKWFLDIFGVIPIAGGESRASLERINELLKAGEVVCLFPEGAISRNGQLGAFKRGYERTVEGVDGVILPFYLRGLWGSRFSRAGEHLQNLRSDGFRHDIIVAFGTPLSMETQAAPLKQAVFDLSISAWEEYTQSFDPLPLAWMRTVKRRGANLCLADAKGGMELDGYKALTGAIAFSRLIQKRSPEQYIGLLLPTSSAGIITNMAALIGGKTLVNLNYTASLPSLQAAMDKAEIKTIYSSRQFISKLQLKGIDLNELLEQVQVVYLEDLKTEISAVAKATIMTFVRLLPATLLYSLFGKRPQAGQPAAILFSSGSEGEPKGVMLSQENIMGNIKQVSDVLDTQEDDVVMASLPLFHAFGLTVTGLMPLIEGIPAICHPDPTDALNIARAVASHQVTVFCGTSTFLRLFNRNPKVHPLMMESLRVVVAGAERLNPEVRDAFQLKFNKPIYEGYGTTETTPVASVNIPDRLDSRTWQVQKGTKGGTVGLPLPGSSFRVVDPESLATLPAGEDGLIMVGGTQVMQGYLKAPEKTAEVLLELDGRRWYSTGDKGHLDEDGFLTIVDRYSRFAKIGGEMISLGAVESAVSNGLPEGTEVMATAMPDGKKGEKVVLLFSGELEQDDLKSHISQAALNPLMTPAVLIKVAEIPKLGSGKADFSAARKLAFDLEA